MVRFIIATAILVSGTNAYAEYVAVGPITASSCKQFFIFGSCETVTVDAASSQGTYYELKRVWPEVDQYDKSTETCKVKVGSGGDTSLISSALKAATAPTFYTRKGNDFEKINIETIRFKCKQAK